jgi:hypothetical protein
MDPDPDPRCPKTYGSGFGSATLVRFDFYFHTKKYDSANIGEVTSIPGIFRMQHNS